MREVRIFVDAGLEPGTEFSLPVAAAHHVTRVLRLKAGQPLTLFNGRGGQHAAVIKAVDRHDVRVTIGECLALDRESPLAITLVQAISRGRHMDTTLQKAVELGVARIVPVLSERGQVRLDDRRLASKLEHWQGILIAACEQSGRNCVPELMAPVALLPWLRERDQAVVCLFLDPAADRSLHDLSPPVDNRLALLAGPEGGFSPEERQAALAAGCLDIRLGPRTLRTETTGLAAITACQALWGDLA